MCLPLFIGVFQEWTIGVKPIVFAIHQIVHRLYVNARKCCININRIILSFPRETIFVQYIYIEKNYRVFLFVLIIINKKDPFSTKNKKYLFVSNREVCDAIGDIGGKDGASVYCMDKCLVYPPNCPSQRCRCYWTNFNNYIRVIAWWFDFESSHLSIASNLSCIHIQWITRFPFFDNNKRNRE